MLRSNLVEYEISYNSLIHTFAVTLPIMEPRPVEIAQNLQANFTPLKLYLGKIN